MQDSVGYVAALGIVLLQLVTGDLDAKGLRKRVLYYLGDAKWFYKRTPSQQSEILRNIMDSELKTDSTWAFGLNRQFGSVYSVAIKFGLQASPPDRFSKKLKTAKFGFGFLILVFGFSRINQKLLPPATTIQNYIKMNTSNSIYDIIDISNP